MSKERASKAVKPSVCLLVDGSPTKVIKIIQGKRGKGGGFVKATMKTLGTGKIFDRTYSSDDIVEVAEMARIQAQYSWKDGTYYVFMDSNTFEEYRLDESVVENADLLVSGLEVKLTKFEEQVIGVTLPDTAEYKVVRLDPGKSQGKELPALLDCGAVIMVPEFIETGTKIKIHTASKQYISRSGDSS